MRNLTFCLLFLLAVSFAKADDIATIRSFLDNKTDDAEVLHNVYLACLSLTRTGTEEAVPVLTQLLTDERFTTVARTALINIPGGKARTTPPDQELTQDAAWLALLLQDGDKGTATLLEALKKESPIPFRMTLRAVLEMKQKDIGKIVLAHMGNLFVEQQAALVRNLGARADSVAIVPQLIELASGRQPELQFAALEALGEIGDLRAVDILLLAASDANAKLATSATASLKLFTGEEFEKKMIAMLDSGNKKLRLAALDIIGERQMDAAIQEVGALFTDSDYEIRAAAYRAFALISPAMARNIRMTFSHMREARREYDQKILQEAILVMCRRTAERDKAIEDIFVHELDGPNAYMSDFFLDCMFAMGGEKAAETIAGVAMKDNDALTDKSTELLGRWKTPEVAPYLLAIAEKHPVERYRSRTLRGYLRVVRQMGLPVEEKIEMAEKALTAARTEADKGQAKEVLTRFRAMQKGKAIFNGKTFDGWEFRNNEEWFRIEDGAIVGGTLDKPIPLNQFLLSDKEYGDFTLRIECKVLGRGANGGVHFRSFRAPVESGMPNEMIGYQADMTDDSAYWGALYDESRRNCFIAEPKRELIESLFRPDDWNEYEIVCRGNNIKLYLNGTLTVDYTEADAAIPARGHFGLQIHSGPPSETWYRNIRVEEH